METRSNFGELIKGVGAQFKKSMKKSPVKKGVVKKSSKKVMPPMKGKKKAINVYA